MEAIIHLITIQFWWVEENFEILLSLLLKV